MKKLKLFVVSMLAMGLSIGAANAAEVKVSDAESLLACLKITDAECVLTKDINVKIDDVGYVDDDEDVANDIDIEKNAILDLGGHTLTLDDDTDLYFSIYVDSNVKLILKNGTVIKKSSMGPVLDVNGTLETSNVTIKHLGQKTAEEIADGEEMSAAITVTGSKRAGEGKLITSADTVVEVPYGNGLDLYAMVDVTLDGTWNTRDAVILSDSANGNTKVTFVGGTYHSTNDTVVNINRGHWTFNDGSLISDVNDGARIAAIPNVAENLSVAINGGSFETKSNAHKAIHSENLTGFVYGGSFKASQTDWEVLPGYLATTAKSYVDNGVTYVGVESPVKVNTPTHGKVTADKNAAITGQTVTVTLEPDEGYVPEITVVDKDGKAVEYKKTGNVLTFVMPASEVTVTVAFEEKADYTAFDEAFAKAIEIDPANFTDESYAALASAIEKAYALDNELSKNHQDEIDAITEELNNAIAGLKDVTAESGTPEIPNTLDSLPLYLIGGSIAILGIAGLGFSIKKKFEN